MTLFDFIKEQLSIADVVSEYVTLKPSGTYVKGSCPFHYETDASFTVSPDKQIFYCFGCQAGGDVIAFIAKKENMSQFEAAQHLIDRYSVQIPKEVLNNFSVRMHETEKKKSYYVLCKSVAHWMHKQLQASKQAKDYLASRAIGQQEIDYFGIGYFPGGMRSMNNFIQDMATQNILAKDLIDVGIIMQGRSVLYSPFEERILFAIKDALGRHCGFGGRIFKSNDQRAKYYNSKDSDWFNKSKLFFGFDLAKKEMQQSAKAFLVEGYTDCIAMVKHGYKATVATLGTACTLDHLKILARFCPILYVMYDGDNAGQKAIVRLTKLCWQVTMELKVITLPSKQDPASFLAQMGDLQEKIEQAQDIFTFFISFQGADYIHKSLAEKLSIAENITQILATLPDSFKRDLLLQEAATVMDVPFDSLKKMLNKNSQRQSNQQIIDNNELEQTDLSSSQLSTYALQDRLIAAVINSAKTQNPLRLDDDVLSCCSQDVQDVMKLWDKISADNDSKKSVSQLLDMLSQAQRSWLIKSVMKYQSTSSEVFAQLMMKFRKKQWRQTVHGIKIAITKAEQMDDVATLRQLLQEFTDIKKQMQASGLL